MAIQVNDTITKNDVINLFNTNVVNYAYNQVVWHSGSYPTGQGFPTNQLGSNAQTTLNNIDGTIITASALVNALKEATRKITKIRNFHYNRYYNSGGSYGLQYESTQLAVWADSLQEPNWANDISVESRSQVDATGVNNPFQEVTASVPENLAQNKAITSSDVITYINNLKNNWDSLKNNTLTVSNYFCYTYSQWLNNRGRR